MSFNAVARAIAVIIGVLTLFFGAWAIVDAPSFYRQIATYPPYNAHLLHDIGAFQAGVGATILWSLFARDPFLLGLIGGSVAAVLHTITHVIDRDLGGKTTDPIAVGAMAVLLIGAAVLRTRAVRSRA